MKQHSPFVVLVCLVAAAFLPTFLHAQNYTVTDLGTLPGGKGSVAYGINAAGQVVGEAGTASGQGHAFLWTASTGMQDLGTLPGGSSSVAYGINAAGQVVGEAGTASGQGHAFLWTASTGMQDLGTLGGSNSRAYGINDSGEVVGTAEPTQPPYDPWGSNGEVIHAFLWTASGGMQDIDTLGASYSEAFGINDSGQVVGANYGGGPVAFLWTASGGMQSMGTLGGSYSEAYGINSSGQVAGGASTSFGFFDGFLSTGNGEMQDLGQFTADAINASGQVVGTGSADPPYGDAFIWTNNHGLQNLNQLNSALAINDNGQIVGYEYLSYSLGEHAILLTPSTFLPPTSTPPLGTFPTSQNFGYGLSTFLQNDNNQFSTGYQTSFSTLGALDMPLITPTGNQFLKTTAKNTATIFTDISDLVDIGLAGSDFVPTGSIGDELDITLSALDLGNVQLSTAEDKISTAYSLVGFVNDIADLSETPITALLGINAFIYGDLLAPQLNQFAALDPPDLNYQTVVVPDVLSFPTLPTTGNVTLDMVLTNQMWTSALAYSYMQAVNTSVNRYSSALAAGDAQSAGLQLQAYLNYLNLYNQAVQNASSLLQTAETLMASLGYETGSYDALNIQDLQSQVSAQGLSQPIVNLLISLGLSQSDIGNVTQGILSMNATSFSGNFSQANSLAASALLTVSTGSQVPQITNQPENQAINGGQTTTFTVAASGTAISSYLWQVSNDGGTTWNNLSDGGHYAGTATATLTVTTSGTGLSGDIYRCQVISSGGITPSSQAALAVNPTVEQTAWLQTYFNSTQLSDPSIVGNNATPANDGIPNLLKYAFDLNPLADGHSSLPAPSISTGELTLTFQAIRNDVTYTVQASTDLINWSTQGVTQQINGDLVTASCSLIGANPIFMRIVIAPAQ